jgi:hypothetical protein
MRRYLLHASLAGITIFAAIWVYVAACPMAFLDDEFPRWSAKQTMLDSCDLGDITVVGDSRAAVDIMPKALPVPTTNLALAGTSTVETYVAVKRLLRCPNLPRAVIISISASHFAGPDTFWEKSARYRFLSRADLEELRHVSARIHDWSLFTLDSPDDLPPFARIWLYASDFPSVYFSALLDNEIFFHLTQNELLYRQVLAARGQYFFHELDQGYDGISAEGHMPRFTVLPILDAYFDHTLSLLAAHHLPAIFVAMPMNDATFAATTADFRDGFAQYLRGYANQYPNFAISGDTMPHVPNSQVGDSLSHLNRAGAARFNQAFAKCASAFISPDWKNACPRGG